MFIDTRQGKVYKQFLKFNNNPTAIEIMFAAQLVVVYSRILDE